MNILDLMGKVALVTGAGQGVGRQVALHLAANNSEGVIVNDYFLERAEEVANEIEKAGGKALPVQADVTDFTSVQTMVEKGNDYFGKIVILVNNAGNAGANPDSAVRAPFWESEPKA